MMLPVCCLIDNKNDINKGHIEWKLYMCLFIIDML